MNNKEVFKQFLDKEEYKPKPPGDYVKRIQKLLQTNLEKIQTSEYLEKPQYTTRRNGPQEIKLTNHALDQFIKRFKKVYVGETKNMTESRWRQLLHLMVNNCNKEKIHKSKMMQHRKEKYDDGTTTVYISYGCFRFVVANMKIVTSEIRGPFKHLN